MDDGRLVFLRLRKRWRRFWFAPAMSADLGACRILFFGLMLVIYLRHDFSAWAGVSDVFWDPVWLFRILHLSKPVRPLILVAQVLWKLSLFLSCVGWRTRWSTAVAALLGTYLIGLHSSFGWIDHSDQILVLTMAILALSRCGDGCSVDRLIFVARGSERDAESPASGEYAWPIRMVWLVMACVFFAAGFSKVRHAGVEWVTSDALASYLIRASDPLGRPVSPPLARAGLALARNRLLSRSFATLSVLLELSFPLALISRRARRVIVPGTFGMLLAIQALMGPNFVRFLIAYVFWVPWHRLRLREAVWRSGGSRQALLFDGACGLCQRTAAVIRSVDVLGRVAFYDAVGAWPSVRDRFPSLQQDACLEEMHVVTSGGRVYRGFDAYRALAWSLPVAWPAAPFLYLPGVPAVGRRVYAAVASRRHHAGCAIPSAGPSSEA